jgi:hypothetical protein
MTEILYFKVQLNGHIKVIESMEKKLKIKNLETLILIEKNNSESLESNTVTAPRLYFKNGYLYVVFTSEILCQFTSFDEALVYLYGLYFCFDVKYPECFKQMLGLFHETLFPNFRNMEVARNLGYMNLSCIIGKKL